MESTLLKVQNAIKYADKELENLTALVNKQVLFLEQMEEFLYQTEHLRNHNDINEMKHLVSEVIWLDGRYRDIWK